MPEDPPEITPRRSATARFRGRLQSIQGRFRAIFCDRLVTVVWPTPCLVRGIVVEPGNSRIENREPPTTGQRTGRSIAVSTTRERSYPHRKGAGEAPCPR